jgi:hypothetical protein
MTRKYALVGALLLVGVRENAWSQALQKLTLTETLRLDANNEDFPSVGAAYIGPRGMIAVPLVTDNQLRLYDSAGKRIAAIGRKGAGPGEFERMLRYGWIGDSVWIYDSSHMRFTLIAATGKLVRTIPLVASLNSGQRELKDPLQGAYSFVPNSYASDGSSLGPATLMTGRSAEGTIATDSWVIRATAAGEFKRLVQRPSSDAWAVRASRGGSTWSWGLPFVFQTQTVYASDGNRFGVLAVETDTRGNGTYSVTIISAAGDTLLRRAYPYTGERIPARQIDSAAKVLEGRAAQMPADAFSELMTKARMRFPITFSPVGSMLLGRDNTIWITKRRTAEGTTAIVHNMRGDPIATVQLSPRSRLLDVSLSEILVSETDDDGLSSVVRYRVSGRACRPPGCQ